MSDPTPHVLLVVDAEEDRRSLHDILAGEGYRLTDAKGADALEVARDLEPCVTLVDGAGAAEVLAKLKSDPGTRDLAVIVLSAAEDAAGLLGDPRRGAADHIAKPFLPAEVIARVRSQVTIRRLERDLERRNEQLERTNRQMRSDLEAAAEVQRSLLPRVAPDVPGVGFAWHYRPCLALAGDSLGVLPLDDRHVALYVLDVSGHGVSSALLSVAVTRSLGLKSDPAALVSVREPGEGFGERDDAAQVERRDREHHRPVRGDVVSQERDERERDDDDGDGGVEVRGGAHRGRRAARRAARRRARRRVTL